MKPLRVAIVQTASDSNILHNIERIEHLLAGTGPSDLVALPEVAACRGSNKEYKSSAQAMDGPLISRMADMARRRKAWLLVGSFAERAAGRVYNTSVLINRSGRITAQYRKIHLFTARLENGRSVRESDAFTPGPPSPVTTTMEGWRAGLAICYDLRFPELFRQQALCNAHILFIPSNFTQRTGKDHWEVLLRARAIENQCFVVAPGQCGTNGATGIASYGNSMVVGPWGEVLARAGTEECAVVVTLDPQLLRDTRRRIPVLKHRRLG
jgi:predicted amidohydrolase